MNIYYILKCPCCSSIIVAHDVLRVHGYRNLKRAAEMLKNSDLAAVAEKFCVYCNEELPCSCEHPTPQSIPNPTTF